MQWGQTLRTGYQLLVDMTVISYFIPFLYLFLAAWKHGLAASALSGLLVTIAGIAFSVIPPDDAGSVWLFEAKLAAGCVLLVLAGRICFRRSPLRPTNP
jgi:ABC-type multidrug transport system permease subunit